MNRPADWTGCHGSARPQEMWVKQKRATCSPNTRPSRELPRFVDNLAAAFDEVVELAVARTERAIEALERATPARESVGGVGISHTIAALDARACVDGDAATLALDRELERIDGNAEVVLGEIEHAIADAESDLAAAIARREQAGACGDAVDALADHDVECAEYQATVERLYEVRDLVRHAGTAPRDPVARSS